MAGGRMATIFNVANRLPITVAGDKMTKSAGGLVSALEGVASEKYRLRWVGWAGGYYESAAERVAIETKLVEEFDTVPIFLSQDDIRDYYDGFSNSSLWPILHYMSSIMRFDEGHWNAYQRVNRLFADRVLELAGEDDLIWVHDYHLMLVPRLLRQARPGLRVGFFFHTPFPSSEVFRCLPRRDELLEGVLGADQIGFHTFGYLRHFRSTVLRTLGLESEMHSIFDGTHHVSLGVYPIGINTVRFETELVSAACYRRVQELQKLWSGKRVVLSVERLDYTKGLVHRLQAVDRFLEEHGNASEMLFIFVSVPSRGDVQEYQELREEIEWRVGQINGRYATIDHSPINFIHNPVPFTELCALYSVADVALVTPLVDGMNLVAKEFVACQRDDPGVLVLSEFAGAAQELFQAVQVNPYDIGGVSEALKKALDMPLDERQRRMALMRGRVFECNADFWASNYLGDLQGQSQRRTQPIEEVAAKKALVSSFTQATRPACFLDYDGTLREFEDTPDAASPSDAIRGLVVALHDVSDADTFIISGRKPADLEQWFQGVPCTLIAEHGNTFRLQGEANWNELNPNADLSWLEQVWEILKVYEGSTPGSMIERKASALVWHYRQSDPEFGRWKANQLVSEIYDMLANLPVEVHHGKKIVEISSIHVNKGAAVEFFLRRNSYDWVLVAGDDQTDESMFRLEHPAMATVKVGSGDTHARYRIGEPSGFRDLLSRMIEARTAGEGAPA
jgi:trehalose 6-phosphate synthase/phosphatase